MQVSEVRGPQPAGLSRRYLIYRPARSEGPRPLVLFLHGAGERGDDLEQVTVHGLPRRIREGFRPDCIVVAPQCPFEQRWQPESLIELLKQVEGDNDVDRDRVYLTGLSMGGSGVWALGMAQAHRFAALAPICGRGDPSRACSIAHIPVWAFHGARDDVVPLQCTLDMVEALRACGAEPRITVYPEADHDSWTETYASPELYAWLFNQRLGSS
jgi:predicted peptidase